MDRNTSVRAAGVSRVGAGTRAGMQLCAPRRGRRLQGKAPQVVEIRANQETGRIGAFFFRFFFFLYLFLFAFVFLFCKRSRAGRRAGFAMHASRDAGSQAALSRAKHHAPLGRAARAGVSGLSRARGFAQARLGASGAGGAGAGTRPLPAPGWDEVGEAGRGPRVWAPRP